MNKKLNCILLVDDNEEDNVFHTIILERMQIANKIEFVLNGIAALDYLKKEGQSIPELIFLDINMPRMNGWEFLEKYKELPTQQKAKAVIMLTTSINPDDLRRSKEIREIAGFKTKPLTPDLMNELLKTHFPELQAGQD